MNYDPNPLGRILGRWRGVRYAREYPLPKPGRTDPEARARLARAKAKRRRRRARNLGITADVTRLVLARRAALPESERLDEPIAWRLYSAAGRLYVPPAPVVHDPVVKGRGGDCSVVCPQCAEPELARGNRAHCARVARRHRS